MGEPPGLARPGLSTWLCDFYFPNRGLFPWLIYLWYSREDSRPTFSSGIYVKVTRQSNAGLGDGKQSPLPRIVNGPLWYFKRNNLRNWVFLKSHMIGLLRNVTLIGHFQSFALSLKRTNCVSALVFQGHKNNNLCLHRSQLNSPIDLANS